MERSYLIQRLKKPFVFAKENEDNLLTNLMKANPFAFGGGLRNGGLSKEAMELLSKIFRFDYMGSSEFEWGAVPEALEKIIKNLDKMITFNIEVKCKTFKKETGQGSVYVICQKDWKDEVIDRIKHYSKELTGQNNQGYVTKEMVSLNRSIVNPDDILESHGWLELDNGYMFFTDKDMFDKICTLFGIKA